MNGSLRKPQHLKVSQTFHWFTQYPKYFFQLLLSPFIILETFFSTNQTIPSPSEVSLYSIYSWNYYFYLYKSVLIFYLSILVPLENCNILQDPTGLHIYLNTSSLTHKYHPYIMEKLLMISIFVYNVDSYLTASGTKT